ncbi:MAG TPA: tRNA pseudouridine(13) synthase TruD [Candidatus Acidoferrales bacterium]|nr:tRNA pseudouridine(13) synthase TruD [Candidatus Acidoferrales bacterium]
MTGLKTPQIPVPDADVKAGMEVYLTRFRGLGGKIRQNVEDFKVDEVYDTKFSVMGKYAIVKVTKVNAETHHVVRDLSRRLGISQKRISWAGTKDKRAVTTQRMSIYNVELKEPLAIPNVIVEPIGRADKPVALGDLRGNDFSMTIRCIEGPIEDVQARILAAVEEIHGEGGVPNFFGIQRFGSIRPVNQLVGKALLSGDMEGAVMTYMAMPFPDEPEAVKEARKFVWDTHNFKEGLKLLPLRLRYERAMMSHLIQSPGDYDGALNVLSINLQRLFVHAYQSYLFNRMLSMRIKRELPLSRGVDGDFVSLNEEKKLRTVVPKNIERINGMISEGRAFIQMPVPGYDTLISDGTIGEIEREVLESEGIAFDQFKLECCPRLRSKGVMRNVVLPTKIEFNVSNDDVNIGFTKVELRFYLQKGSYATSVLREIMKMKPG